MGKAKISGWLPSDGSNKLHVTIITHGGRGTLADANDDVVRYEFSRIGLWLLFAFHAALLGLAMLFIIGLLTMFVMTSFSRSDIAEMLGVLAASCAAAFFFRKSTWNLFREARHPGHEVAITRDHVSIRWFNGIRFRENIVRFGELASIATAKDLHFITFQAHSVFSGCVGFRGVHLTGLELHFLPPFDFMAIKNPHSRLRVRHLQEIVGEVTRRAPHVRLVPHLDKRRFLAWLFD